MGHCRYCGHRAGWLRSSHRQCAATDRQGLAQLVDLVAAASGRPDFTQRRMLRILDALAQQCYVPADYLPAVLAAGWHLSDLNRMVDDVLTRSETARLREFRDGHHPASQTPGDRGASILAAGAARAALATRQRSQRMERVSNLLERSGLSHEESRELLLQAWETAVARQLGDVGIDLDREAALLRYARHFDLDDGELDRYGMLRQFVQGAAIAEAAAGLVPQRMNFPEGAPASALLRRSEQLVWLFDDVECSLGQLPPEPSLTITGVAMPGPGSPLLPAPVVRGPPRAGPGLGIRGTGPIGGGQRTPAFPWTGPQYPVGLRLGGELGAVPRRHRRRAARPTQPPGGFPQRRRLVHLQPDPQPGSPVDRDHARRQPPPESRNRSDRPMTTGESGGDR